MHTKRFVIMQKRWKVKWVISCPLVLALQHNCGQSNPLLTFIWASFLVKYHFLSTLTLLAQLGWETFFSLHQVYQNYYELPKKNSKCLRYTVISPSWLWESELMGWFDWNLNWSEFIKLLDVTLRYLIIDISIYLRWLRKTWEQTVRNAWENLF